MCGAFPPLLMPIRGHSSHRLLDAQGRALVLQAAIPRLEPVFCTYVPAGYLSHPHTPMTRHVSGARHHLLLPVGEPEANNALTAGLQVVREASSRVLGLRPFDVQLIGGMILHKGEIAEMRTGEGKTLVAVLPAYLNALAGEGVHVSHCLGAPLLSRNVASSLGIWCGKGVPVSPALPRLSPPHCVLHWQASSSSEKPRDNCQMKAEQILTRQLPAARCTGAAALGSGSAAQVTRCTRRLRAVPCREAACCRGEVGPARL